MGRWIDYEIQRDFTDWADLTGTHNADCDAYEARIAELEALVRRVKAESLRVVELPADYEFMPDWYMTPDGLGWYGSDEYGNPSIETPHGYHHLEDCKPVRLERWEMEE